MAKKVATKSVPSCSMKVGVQGAEVKCPALDLYEDGKCITHTTSVAGIMARTKVMKQAGLGMSLQEDMDGFRKAGFSVDEARAMAQSLNALHQDKRLRLSKLGPALVCQHITDVAAWLQEPRHLDSLDQNMTRDLTEAALQIRKLTKERLERFASSAES